MKILYVTTIGMTMNFFKSFIGELKNNGNQVDIACNDSLSPVSDFYEELGCDIYTISCTRSPFNTGVFKAINEIKKLVEKENYDIVHCHTPIAAMCTRLACLKVRKNGTKVIYTAHGFHFYKGAPLKNWLVYYPIEKVCSYFTDVLITINKEDYALAQAKMKAKKVAYLPGVGIDTTFFAEKKVDKDLKRQELNVPKDAFLMLSVGELNANKNHKTVIEALSKIENRNVHYVIAGKGDLQNEIINFAKKCGLEDRVHLIGQRTDVADLYKTADCFVHPSFREGLPVSVMEAIASGAPIIVSTIRGNNDLINCDTGYTFSPYNSDDFCKAFNTLQKDIALNAVKYNKDILQYDKTTVNSALYNLYIQ